MRAHISGPHLGPVHTTLWSSGSRKGGSGGKVLAAIFLLPALVLLAMQFRYWPVDVIALVLIGLGVIGWRDQRKS